MFVRNLGDVEKSSNFVEWGNGTSHRLLTASDNMGFTVCHTVVRAGTRSRLHYKNHLEACYCIGGSGAVEELDGTRHPINVGDIYVLDDHDDHFLIGGDTEDLILVSVFNPPLNGDEKHNLNDPNGSAY